MNAQLAAIDVEFEAIPFSFEMKSGGHELRPAVMVLVIDLKALIFHTQNENDRLVLG